MVESKNLKLKLGLCGLALTSFLAINAHSTVHADTVDANNSNQNAITWDSDNDDSQVVKEEPQQDNASQSVQKQATVQSNAQIKQANATQNMQPQGAVQEQKAPATQSEQTQNTPKADDDQQHVQSVQPNRVEMSTVRSSSVQRQAVVQNNADYNETLSSLGSNTNLGDLGVYDVSPDSVKSNIQSQVQSQLAINDASLANFNMNKDASGNLTASFGVYSNTAKQQNWWTNVKVNNTVVPGIQWRTNADTASDGNLHEASTGKPIVYSVGIHKLPGAVIYNPAGDVVKVHYVDSNGKAVSGINDASINVSKSGTGKYTVPNGYQLVDPNGTYTITSNKHVVHHPAETHVVHHDATGHYENVQVQHGYDWQNESGINENTGQWEEGKGSGWSETNDGAMNGQATSYTPHYDTETEWVEDSPAYDETVVDKNAWDETVGDDTFTDKSGNAKSATGNVVNVVVTKPQNVDPNSAQCNRQATRVIHVTFPNGVKPESYDSITDSAGNKLTFDSNNNLTQTVTFTRSETVDSLTGATLTQTPWQQHGAINAVTLPAIPGYTMVTTN